MKIYSYLVIATLGFASLGCSKKKDETPAPSKTDLLTDKNWVATAYTVSPGIVFPGGTTVTDIYAQSQPCDRDDFIRFEKPNVLKNDEGATKCSPTDPQTTTGTWVFNADQTIITVTQQGGAPQSLNIMELTDTSLKCNYTLATGTPAITYTFTITYRKG